MTDPDFYPIRDAVEDGYLCELQFADACGTYRSPSGKAYFLHNGKWFQYDPPYPVEAKVVGFRRIPSERAAKILNADK
jgi:hypothetical protein